jgi:hypothetical protein
MNTARRTLAVSAAAALTAGTIAIAPAAQAAAMHMTPKLWHVYATDGGDPHRVDPGGTYTSPCGEGVTQIYLKVRVTHAHADRPFKVIWTQDGTRVDRYAASYSTSGTLTDWFAHPRSSMRAQAPRGLVATLADGTYKVVFKQGGRKVGGNKITLESTVC